MPSNFPPKFASSNDHHIQYYEITVSVLFVSITWFTQDLKA